MVAVKQKRKANISKYVFYTCMMALPFLQFFVLWFCVNVNSILLAFKNYDYDTGKYTWYAFENFAKVFENMKDVPFFAASVKNSLIIYLSSLVIGTPLSILFAFYIYKKMPMNGLFRTLLFVPHILSALIMVILYKYFVDRAIPILFEGITGKAIKGLLANSETAFATIIFYNVWTGFGSSTVIYSSTMSGISESVVEAAKLDGATGIKELIYITVPMIWSTFATFVVVGFAGLFTSQANLYNFYGDKAEYSFYTFGYYLYTAIRSASISEYPYLSALGLVLTAIALPLTLGLRKLTDKVGSELR